MTVREPITKHTRGFLGAETVQTGALLTGRLIHSDTNITMVRLRAGRSLQPIPCLHNAKVYANATQVQKNTGALAILHSGFGCTEWL